MLGFAPLASSALASTPSQAALPELLAAAASSVALSGLAAAQVPAQLAAADQVSLAGLADTSAAVGGHSALALGLPLAGQGHAAAELEGAATPIWVLSGQAHLRTAAQGGASLFSALVGTAQITSGLDAGLQSELGLAGEARVQLSPEARTTGRFDLPAAAQSAVRTGGSAATVLVFPRHAVGEGFVDVALSRSLPLGGSAAARLAGAATVSGPVWAVGTARADASEVSQASGQIALGGVVRASGVPASTAAGQPALGGSGAVASRVSAGLAVGLAITGQSQAGVAARGQAVEGIAAAGLGYAASLGQGRGALLLTSGLQAAAKARSAAPAEGQIALPGQASLFAPILGYAQPSQLVLTGRGAGTILAVRMARGAGTLPLAGQGHAAGMLKAKGDGAVAMRGISASTVTVGAVSSSQLGLARALEAELLVAASAGRAIPLAGTAKATAQAYASAQAPRLAFDGGASVRSSAVASTETNLAVGVACTASCAVTAVGQLALDAQVQVSGAVGAEGALASVLDLRGTAACVTDQKLRAEDAVALQILASGRGAAIGIAVADHDLAGGANEATANSVAGQGGFAVTRAFAGDVDVLGDSARLIGFGGAGLARTSSTGKTSNSVVELAGSAAARVTAQAELTAGVALVGDAQIRVVTVAASSGSIGWTTSASATAPRSAQSQGSLFLAGACSARSAAMATATAAALAIDGALAGATGLAGDLRSDLLLEGTASAILDASAQGAGQFDVARNSEADVQVTGDAGHGMPLIGVADGAAHVQAAGSISTARLEITAQVRALNMTSAASGSLFTAQGQVTGQASLHGTSQGHVSVTRLGRGDILVAGTAARAMVFLGAAEARSLTQAAANLPLEPGFAGAGTTVTRVAFHAQEVLTGRGAALSTVQAVDNASGWELGATAIAYRAPPALRRSEPPRVGLSGRLIPSNTGRILKG
jgi:hypothetical protein